MPNTRSAREFGTNRKIVVDATASGPNASGVQPVALNYWRNFIERWENNGGAGENRSDLEP
jgi:hypothetical protein